MDGTRGVFTSILRGLPDVYPCGSVYPSCLSLGDRRDIWFGEDMAGAGKRRSEWNAILLRDVIAPIYASLVVKARDVSKTHWHITLEIYHCTVFFILNWRRSFRMCGLKVVTLVLVGGGEGG